MYRQDLVFARAYPRAELRVVTTGAQPEFEQQHQGIAIGFVSLGRLIQEVTKVA
jgi:hypothetical protein